jgi:hypothetical protein
MHRNVRGVFASPGEGYGSHMTDERLRGWATTVTGEEVLAAGRFVLAEGVGGTTTTAMGMAAGVGGQNQLLTTQAEGEATAEAEHQGPPAYVLVAVTPDVVHVLESSLDAPEGPADFGELTRFDRAHLSVKVHHRIGARHLELEDTESNNRLVFTYGRHQQDDDTKAVVRELTE